MWSRRRKGVRERVGEGRRVCGRFSKGTRRNFSGSGPIEERGKEADYGEVSAREHAEPCIHTHRRTNKFKHTTTNAHTRHPSTRSRPNTRALADTCTPSESQMSRGRPQRSERNTNTKKKNRRKSRSASYIVVNPFHRARSHVPGTRFTGPCTLFVLDDNLSPRMN